MKLYLNAFLLLVPGGAAAVACGGEDGKAGPSGEACTVAQNTDGSATITCPDGSTADVAPSTPGGMGGSGDAATCTVTDNEDGTATIACGEQEPLTLVTCAGGTYRCVEDSLERCGAAGWAAEEECGAGECNAAGGYCGPEPGTFRLAGGTEPHEGRVEVFYDGVWGTVCDDDFDTNDNAADVLCKQLGYASGVQSGNSFGAGTGPIWLDDIECDGTEASLLDCSRSWWGSHNCDHSEDVGVVCTPAAP